MPRTLMVLATGLFLVGCSEQVHVSVNCVTVADPAVECTLVQKQGKTEVEVCWDFEVTCGNGAVVTAPKTCQRIGGGSTAKARIEADKLNGLGKCAGDTPPKAVLSNLTLNGEPMVQ